MTDTDMTSDILIYNILEKSSDEFIQECNLKFIDRSVPAQEDDTIYVANVDLETVDETFEDVRYNALVNIYVKTKNTDYLDASRFLRTVVKHIKAELWRDDDCKERNIRFRNTRYEYGSGYTLKGLHLMVQLHESECKFPDNDDEDYSCVVIEEDDDDIVVD